MAIYRAQIAFQLDSALPRDAVTINPHYFGDNAQGLANALKANLLAHPAVSTIKPFKIKIYDAQKPPPSFPLAEAANGTGFATTSIPREMALCLSYYSSFNRPSYRGRLYIPMALIGGQLNLRPTQAQIDEVLTWGPLLGKQLPAQHNWVIYSRKRNASDGVTAYWCDNEWDVVRSRGLRGDARSTGTIP